jgi:hypothetical protein
MVAVAVLGLAAAATLGREQVTAWGSVQREQALAVLEYQAERAAAGKAPDPAIAARLLAALPDAELRAEPGDGIETYTVTWRPPSGGTAHRSLTVFVRGGGR